MEHNYSFEYNELEFKPFTLHECELYRQLRNKPENIICFKTQKEISADEQNNWYSAYLNRENDFMFAVYCKGRFIGSVAVYDVDFENKSAEFGRILIGTKGKGYGKTATDAMSFFSKKELGLEKLRLDVYCDNNAAYKTYQKCGYETCGETYDLNNRKMYLMVKEL